MFTILLSTVMLLYTSLFSFAPATDYLGTLANDEKKEMVQYLESFPYYLYGIYKTEGVGSFYVDDLDDGIKNWVRLGEKWEENILNLLITYIKPGTVTIDIGAHIGLHSLNMSNCVGKEGTLYAFEPQKKLYRELVMNMILNNIGNIKAYRLALGNEDKMVYMNPPAAHNEGGTGIGRDGDSVQLTKLDNFQFQNVSLIKIDVEGFENQVLEGAKETILHNRPVIIIEIMGGHDYNTASQEVRDRIDYTKAKLEALGYDVQKVGIHDYLALPKNHSIAL